MQEPFVRLPRSFFESGYWRQSRTYNECEALLDIISQVRFEASEQFARIGGREVTWGLGEWPASIRFLAERWKWTERRVRTFLMSLKRNEVITTDDSQGVNIIKLIKYTKSDTVIDTASDTTNVLNVNEITKLVTQQVTQLMTQHRHSSDTNTKNGKNIMDSSLRSESTHTNSACISFIEWLSEKCPYIYSHYNLLSDVEFEKLKAEYGSKAIADECLNIENRVDLRKKYSNLYRTLLNWLKRSRNETTTINKRYHTSDGHPTDEQLVKDTYDLINEARAREASGDSW